MGFYLRKSLRAGPFRFNFSKSGIGVSAGVPGFRVGTGPRGNYVHVGGHGVYYRATLGGRTRSAPAQRPPLPAGGASPIPAGWRPAPSSEIVMEDVTGATAEQLLPSSADDFVAQMNEAGERQVVWPWVLVPLIVLALAAPPAIGIFMAILGLPGVAWLYLRDRARRSVVAFYEVEGPQAAWFQTVVDAFTAVGACSGLWRINASGRVTTTYQYKTNAGAGNIIDRARVSTGMSGPAVLVTNIAVPSIDAGRQSLHFLPDRVLVRDGRRFASLSYSALHTDLETTRFIESGSVPRDAQQVDVTWQYVNVKGGPDRRYKDNRQMPVMLYGRLTLASPDGLQWIVDCSRVPAIEYAASVLRRAVAPQPIAAPKGAPIA